MFSIENRIVISGRYILNSRPNFPLGKIDIFWFNLEVHFESSGVRKWSILKAWVEVMMR